MPADSQKDFIETLLASEIVSAGELKDWGAGLKETPDAKSLAAQLVESGRLTSWQANYLLKGRSRLRFGNYILTDRLDRNDLGDAFVGRHDKLDRQVHLLFLSKQNSIELAANDKLVRELAASTDVDHPNLEQVHLIDQDSGRYMFVTQQISGKSLNDPALLTNLDSAQVPDLLRQIVGGLSAANRVGLAHGGLSENDIHVDEAGKVLLSGFLSSNIKSKLIDKRNPSPADDISALKQIVRRLVKRFDSNANKAMAYDFEKAGDDVSALEAIAIKHCEAAEQGTERPTDAVASPQTETPRPLDSAERPKTVPASSSEPNVPQKSGLIRNILWVTGGVLALATIFVVGQKLLGNNSIADSNDASSAVQNDDLPGLADVLQSKTEPNLGNDTEEEQNLPQIPERQALIDSSALDSDLDAEPNNGVNLEIASESSDTVASAFSNSDDPALIDSGTSTQEQGSSQKPAVTKGSSFLDKFKATADEPDSLVASEATPKAKNDTTAAKAPSKTNPVAPPQPTEQTTPVATTVNGVPLATDLPPTTIQDVLSIANFDSESLVALDIKLISDETISTNGNTTFTLSGERNGSWDVSHIASGSKTKVGQFVQTDYQLGFKWLQEAAAIDGANYLRNCVLKIKTGTSTHFLRLRKPMIVPGFTLGRDNPRLKVEIDGLDFLPKDAIAQLHDLDVETYGDIFFVGSPEKKTFSRKQPLQLAFSEIAEYQMVLLTLSADIKKKSKLEALLQVRLAPGQKPRLANDKTMESAKQFMEQYIVEVTNNYETLKKMKVDELRKQMNMTKDELPNSDKKAREKQLKEESEIAKKRAEIFRAGQTQLEAFFKKPIPVSIYYKLGDQRIELATSVIPRTE